MHACMVRRSGRHVNLGGLEPSARVVSCGPLIASSRGAHHQRPHARPPDPAGGSCCSSPRLDASGMKPSPISSSTSAAHSRVASASERASGASCTPAVACCAPRHTPSARVPAAGRGSVAATFTPPSTPPPPRLPPRLPPPPTPLPPPPPTRGRYSPLAPGSTSMSAQVCPSEPAAASCGASASSSAALAQPTCSRGGVGGGDVG